MLINIKTSRGFLPDEAAEKICAMEFPAVLLDKNLKLLAINAEAKKFAPFLRKGMKFSQFFKEGDEEKVLSMSLGETMFSSVSGNKFEFRANIICGVDCYLTVMRVGSMQMRDAVLEKYEKMSGYDTAMVTPDIPVKNEKSANVIEGIIAAALFKQLSPRTLPFFNAAAICKGLLGEFETAFSDFSNRVKIKTSQDELISEGDERDFALMFAVMISLCLDFSDGRIAVELKNDGDELAISIESDVDATIYGIAKLTSFDNRAESFEPSDEIGFRAYMLKLLADSNLWDFSSDCEGGQLCLSLRTPYVKRGEEFMVHDVSASYIKKLVNALAE